MATGQAGEATVTIPLQFNDAVRFMSCNIMNISNVPIAQFFPHSSIFFQNL